MKFRNFKMVGYVVYGRGSFNQLDEILAPHRKGKSPMIFCWIIFLKINHWSAGFRSGIQIKLFLPT